MPSSKYYRCILPHDLLSIIGSMSGDNWLKLVFTYSPKRRFLSTIKIVPRFNYMNTQLRVRNLTRNSWRPVTLGDFNIITALRVELGSFHLGIFDESIHKIHKLLSEVLNYTLLS